MRIKKTNTSQKITITIDYSNGQHLFVLDDGATTTNISKLPSLCTKNLQIKQGKEIEVYIISNTKLKVSFSETLIKLFNKNNIKVKSFSVPISIEPGRMELIH